MEEETRASSRERETPLARRVTHSITGDEGADVERDPLFTNERCWSGSDPASTARREATNFCVLRSTRRSSPSVQAAQMGGGGEDEPLHGRLGALEKGGSGSHTVIDVGEQQLKRSKDALLSTQRLIF